MGLTFNEFITNELQAVLWFEGYEPTAKDVVRLAAGKWSSFLDGEPVLLPNAAGLPPDLPRAIVPSADSRWKMQLSARRVDLAWDQQGDRESTAPANFAEVAQDCFAPFIDVDVKLRVTRIAYVIRRYLLVSDPGKTLATYFVRDELRSPSGPLNRPEGFEFHAHKKYRPENLPELNSWIRWRTAKLVNGDAPVITVSQDLNTPEGRDQTFTASETEAFLRNAAIEANGILKLYLGHPPAR